MNHIFDTEDEGQDSTQLKFLETLIDKLIKRLEEDSYKPKVQDALKAIQLKHKVAKTSEVERSETHRAEKIFWQEIEAIRNEELPKLYPQPNNLESQITNTIARLKYLVTNGILPVKTITDTFNQNRSKESQLTYSRLGRILSVMGFRKTKTSSGSSAIIWDDQLLTQDTDSNAHNSLPETCLEACLEEKSEKNKKTTRTTRCTRSTRTTGQTSSFTVNPHPRPKICGPNLNPVDKFGFLFCLFGF